MRSSSGILQGATSLTQVEVIPAHSQPVDDEDPDKDHGHRQDRCSRHKEKPPDTAQGGEDDTQPISGFLALQDEEARPEREEGDDHIQDAIP